MSKVFTAKEMREMALVVLDDVEGNDEGGAVYPSTSKFDETIIEAMLRQAADMIERCVKARSRHSLYYGKLDHEDETEIVDEIDYIIHGDTRKEHDDGE